MGRQRGPRDVANKAGGKPEKNGSWDPREDRTSRRKLLVLLNAAERSSKIRTEQCPLD